MESHEFLGNAVYVCEEEGQIQRAQEGIKDEATEENETGEQKKIWENADSFSVQGGMLGMQLITPFQNNIIIDL